MQSRPSTPEMMSPAEVAAIKIPRGIHLASLPWPSGGELPKEFHLAQLPWLHDRGAADISRLHIIASSGYGTGALANPLHLVHRAYVPWPKFPGLTLPITGKFVTALCRDSAGNIWIATEDHGVFCYNPSAPKGRQIQQFTRQSTHGQLGNNNIYALACDNHGRIWAGTLNHGVSVYNGRRWQAYDMVQNPTKHVLAGPLGDHVFALKFDTFTNQMWICTEAGISIYQCNQRATSNETLRSTNNDTRQKPGVGSGQLEAPGNAPLRNSTPATYNLSPVVFTAGTWHYLTQADGLPQNPDCIAFNPNGTVYVGTQCDGVAIATVNEQRATNNGQHGKSGVGGEKLEVFANAPLAKATHPRPRVPGFHSAVSHVTALSYNRPASVSAAYQWRVVTGPWKMPLTATGKGLPSNLINAIVFEPNGTLIAGTDGGIGVATNQNAAFDSSPADWTFMRGRDLTAKVAGLWHPPHHWKAPSRKVLNTLPMEDYTTALAITENRLQGKTNLWLGHRRRGVDVWQYNTAGKIIKRWQIHEPQIGNYVTSLLPLPGGAMAVGTYGKGASIIMLPGASDAWKNPDRTAIQTHAAPGFAGANAPTTGGQAVPDGTRAIHEPKPAAAPNVRQLAALYQSLLKNPVSQQMIGPPVVPITDDWRTQGSWLGRYGRYWACLFACGMHGGYDFVWRPRSVRLRHSAAIGPHRRTGDIVQFHTTWPASARKRVLELPEVYLAQRISAHRASRKKDRRETELDDHGETYPLDWQGPGLYVYLHIPPGAYTLSLYFFNKDGHSENNRDRDYVVSMIPVSAGYHFGTASRPNTAPLAKMRGISQSRVVNFWGGVWKRFLVRGPVKLAIRVAKNYSFNTILQAAMLDPLSQHPAPYYYGYAAWQAHESQRGAFRVRQASALRSGQFSDDAPASQAVWHRHPADDPTVNTGIMRSQNILNLLSLLEHRDPATWAAGQQLACSMILRWCVARYGAIPKNPQAAGVAEKCCYALDLFRRWEALEKSRGVLTSRQIEKGLRLGVYAASFAGLSFGLIRWRTSQLRHPYRVLSTSQRLDSSWWLLDGGEGAGGNRDRRRGTGGGAPRSRPGPLGGEIRRK